MGRAAWCARGRRPSRFCCLLPRQISGRRAACPPARRPRRELRSARRLEARPGPAGLAAASNRSGLVVSVLSVSLRCRPPAPRPGPSVPPAPFTPVGPGVLMGGWARRFVVRPGPAAARQTCLTNLACNSPATISNVEFTALKSQRFQTLLNLHPIELHASFLRSGRIGACWRRRRSPLARCAVV